MRRLWTVLGPCWVGLAACGGGAVTEPSGADASGQEVDASLVDARAGGPDARAGAPDARVPVIDAAGGGADAAPLPAPTCDAVSGAHAATSAPVLLRSFVAGGEESWLSAPAVVDLDGDGEKEILAAHENLVTAWRPGGAKKWSFRATGDRIWAPPVVGNFAGDGKLEVVFAARGRVYMLDAAGAVVQPFPVMWRDEIRGLSAGDLDNDGKLEIVAVTTNRLIAGDRRDLIQVFRADGSVQPGFPPNTSGTSGCDDICYITGGFDQNIAVGAIDDVPGLDLLAPQDNAYISWHRGNGVAYDAAEVFRNRNKVPGIRWFLDYADARYGTVEDEDTALQAHFTRSAPAIANLDGAGGNEMIVLGSVQNASQEDRLKGVVLFVFRSDGTRAAGWETPFHVPAYLAGLWDLEDNIVGATNEVAVADLDPATAGADLVFAGFDGKIHAVTAARAERWSYAYTTATDVLTSGVVVADLTKDGVPEIVFATYSTRQGVSELVVLDAAGKLQKKLTLPGRGAMAVPAIADLDGDHTLEIVVSLKDPTAGDASVLAYEVADSSDNCLLWPTARGNLLRSGAVTLP